MVRIGLGHFSSCDDPMNTWAWENAASNVSRELDKVLVWIKKLHLFRLFMCHENFRLEVTLLTLKAGLGRKKS